MLSYRRHVSRVSIHHKIMYFIIIVDRWCVNREDKIERFCVNIPKDISHRYISISKRLYRGREINITY